MPPMISGGTGGLPVPQGSFSLLQTTSLWGIPIQNPNSYAASIAAMAGTTGQAAWGFPPFNGSFSTAGFTGPAFNQAQYLNAWALPVQNTYSASIAAMAAQAAWGLGPFFGTVGVTQQRIQQQTQQQQQFLIQQQMLIQQQQHR